MYLVSQVAHTDLQCETPIPLIYNCMVTKHQRFCSLFWTAHFSEDDTHHKCLKGKNSTLLHYP